MCASASEVHHEDTKSTKQEIDSASRAAPWIAFFVLFVSSWWTLLFGRLFATRVSVLAAERADRTRKRLPVSPGINPW